MKTIHLSTRDQYYGITLFLEKAARYWSEFENNNDRANEGYKYIDTIEQQCPVTEHPPYTVTVPSELKEYAKQSSMGVEHMLWEVDEAPPEEIGQIETAEQTLTSL